MQVLFESRDPDGASQRELAEQRLRFVMRRLSWMLPRVRVQLNDINGPRGGVDKQCRLEINTDRGGTLVVTALARDWRSALDSALLRAARSLLRLLQRGRSQQQRPPRRLPQAQMHAQLQA